jgi:hypothetical protein
MPPNGPRTTSVEPMAAAKHIKNRHPLEGNARCEKFSPPPC